MEVVTKPKVTRFAQLQPGDLFIFQHPAGTSVAVKATDPVSDGDPLAVVVGPSFPVGPARPMLYNPSQTTVVSFGKDYTIRLPSSADGWRTNEPPAEADFIVVTDAGGVFLRANFRAPAAFSPCYVDMSSGEILCNKAGRQYIEPREIKAFALAWELLTNEQKPRPIFSYPIVGLIQSS